MLNSKCRRLRSAAIFLFWEAVDCDQRPFFLSEKLSTAINSVSQHSEKLSTAVSGRFFVAGSFRLRSIPSPSIQRSFRLPSAAIFLFWEAVDCDQFRLPAFREAFDCRQRPFPSRGKSSTAISGHFRPRAGGRRTAPSAPWLSGCRPPWVHYLTGGLSPCEHK